MATLERYITTYAILKIERDEENNRWKVVDSKSPSLEELTELVNDQFTAVYDELGAMCDKRTLKPHHQTQLMGM